MNASVIRVMSLCKYFTAFTLFHWFLLPNCVDSYGGGKCLKRSDRRYLTAFNLQWHFILHCLLISLILCSSSLSVSRSLFLTVVVLYIQGIGTKEWREVSRTIHFSQGHLL